MKAPARLVKYHTHDVTFIDHSLNLRLLNVQPIANIIKTSVLKSYELHSSAQMPVPSQQLAWEWGRIRQGIERILRQILRGFFCLFFRIILQGKDDCTSYTSAVTCPELTSGKENVILRKRCLVTTCIHFFLFCISHFYLECEQHISLLNYPVKLA